MMSGGSEAPPTSTSPSPSSLPPSVPPFLSPSNVTGVRFPLYATIQGVNSPLLYSPTLFGQSVLPWRPLVTTPSSTGNIPITAVTGVSSAISLPPSSTSHPPTSTVVTGYTTSFAQLPGFMYPIPSLNMPLVMTDTNKKAGDPVVTKRRNEAPPEGSEEVKRPRVATATPPTQSTSSTPSPQPPLLRPTPHRSPVIKYNLLPYNIGGAVVAGSPGQQTTPTTLAPTVILSITPQTSSKLTSHSSLLPATPIATPTTSSSTPPSLPILPTSLVTLCPSLPLPTNLLITLLRCFGPMPSHSSIPVNQLVTSDLLLDLYRSSYHTTSEISGNLSPESCALLTISYLSSLRRGERICVESLHTMLKYARMGESEWLQYYKRHKKMSESTFVQSQLMHLSRIAVYPALGRVRVMISSEHLGQGITLTMKNLSQLMAVSSEALPDYIVVLAVRPNIGVEFCVLVLEPLQSQLLLWQQKSKSRRLYRGGGRNVGGPGEGGNLSPHRHVEIKIERKLLLMLRRMQKRLKGAVHIPFREPGNDSMTVSQSKAESMTPSAPHVIEHKPQGPFQEQYNVAMHLMQRIGGGTAIKLENFRNLDFCVLCPPEENFVREIKRRVVESGLVDLVMGEREDGGEGDPLEERVICCCEMDYNKFSKLLNSIHGNQETLYLVIVEHADITSTLLRGVVNNTYGNYNNRNRGNCCYGEHKILLTQTNVIMLYVTSRPYRLVTNRFLVSTANEIHWPVRGANEVKGQREGEGEGGGRDEVEFCCVGGLPGATVKGAWSGGVVVSEDDRMEEEFHHLTVQLCPEANFLQIRHQLLLNDYVTALSNHTHSTSPAHTDTQSIVQCLVEEPLISGRGHGPMVLIRSHDGHMGRQFFCQLKAARDALGLQYRFEVLLDSGREGLKLSPHFLLRVAKGGLGNRRHPKSCYSNGCLVGDGLHSDDDTCGNGCHSNQDHVTYSDLDNVPCIVVMTGVERPHVPLPSSLRWVDLRLLYPTDITRSLYEAELAWANGYFPSPPSPFPPTTLHERSHDVHHLHKIRTTGISEKDLNSHHSDSEDILSESHDSRPHPPATGALSSSSSRRSSVTDLTTKTAHGDQEGGGRERSGVVEWHPKTTADSDMATSDSPSHTGLDSPHHDHHYIQERSLSGSEGERGEGGEGEEEEEGEGEGEGEGEVIDVNDLPAETPPTTTMTTTVVIDPPDDQMDSQSEGGTWSYSHSASISNHWNSLETATEEAHINGGGATEHEEEGEGEEVQLFADLSDSESDSEDEREALPLPRTCLLSRPFYHIWTSRNPQQALLLPPAVGVEWASPSSKHSRSSSHSTTSTTTTTTPTPSTSSTSQSAGTPTAGTADKTRRPPLFDPDPAHQTGYYRRWSKPGNSAIKKAMDMLLRATMSGMKRRFLLTGPSQVGKTGVWQLLIRLLHDHLRSSHSVTVERPQPQHSIILQDTPTSLRGTHSCVVAPGYLKELYQELLENEDKKPFPSLPPSPPHQPPPTHQATPTPTTTLPLSPHAIQDRTHSCAPCSDHLKTNMCSNYTILTQSFPTSHDSHVTAKWCVPASMNSHCVTDRDKQVLERLCLPTTPPRGSGDDPDPDLLSQVPIFIPSVGRETSALLNLSHSGFTGLYVVVTVIGEMQAYMRAWPGVMIMALPDKEAVGRGMLYCRLKQFLHHNYQQNCMASSSKSSSSPLPWILVMSDGCVMWRKMERGGDPWRGADLSLSQVLQSLSQEVDTSSTAVISLPQWTPTLPPSPTTTSHSSHLTDCDINHDFILLNVAMTTNLHYRVHSYTSHDTDFNLQLFTSGLKSVLYSDISVVKKHFPPSDPPSLLHSNVTAVAAEVDDIAVSLHDSASSLMDYPGPYLLEHYLRHKSRVLFPSAHSPKHPVLMIDHYVNLGPQTFVSYLQSSTLDDTLSQYEMSSIKFGGLVLYLCEGCVAKQQLRHLSFVTGACLCLVTERSGSLVGEVGRLDLEERWKFRLRDEYKTACPNNDSFRPLYFLIGRFGL